MPSLCPQRQQAESARRAVAGHPPPRTACVQAVQDRFPTIHRPALQGHPGLGGDSRRPAGVTARRSSPWVGIGGSCPWVLQSQDFADILQAGPGFPHPQSRWRVMPFSITGLDSLPASRKQRKAGKLYIIMLPAHPGRRPRCGIALLYGQVHIVPHQGCLSCITAMEELQRCRHHTRRGSGRETFQTCSGFGQTDRCHPD